MCDEEPGIRGKPFPHQLVPEIASVQNDLLLEEPINVCRQLHLRVKSAHGVRIAETTEERRPAGGNVARKDRHDRSEAVGEPQGAVRDNGRCHVSVDANDGFAHRDGVQAMQDSIGDIGEVLRHDVERVLLDNIEK